MGTPSLDKKHLQDIFKSSDASFSQYLNLLHLNDHRSSLSLLYAELFDDRDHVSSSVCPQSLE